MRRNNCSKNNTFVVFNVILVFFATKKTIFVQRLYYTCTYNIFFGAPFFCRILKHSRTESVDMTLQLFSNFSLRCRAHFLLSIAILGSAFFIDTAMAAGGSTPIQGLDNTKPVVQKAVAPIQSITATPTAECPLNSGGPSLLGTTWRLDSLYGNKVPKELQIDMRVSTTSLTGIGGCNKYSANFKQVGYTGFSVKSVNRTKKKCKVIVPYKTAKSINVGSWEGSFLRTLGRMGSVRQITATKLYFFNRNGQIGLKLHKIEHKATGK